MDVNNEISELLYRDSVAFLENHQSVIKTIVMKFVGSGLFKYNETEDVIQHINESLLTGVLEKMQVQYNPAYNLQSYFSKIICNLCLQYAKKEFKRNIHRKSVDLSYVQIATDETITDGIALGEMYEHLNTLLSLYGERRHRIELLLKISLGIDISKEDVLRCYPNCSAKTLKNILIYFEHPNEHGPSSRTAIYEKLIPFVNELEGANNMADTLRKFVDRNLDEFAEILSIPPINAALTRETMIIFLEKYYSEFPKPNKKVIL